MSNKTVTFLADVIRETEKAIMIELPGVRRNFWLPKSISTVAERENEFSKKPETIITIPAWKARDFGGAMLMI